MFNLHVTFLESVSQQNHVKAGNVQGNTYLYTPLYYGHSLESLYSHTAILAMSTGKLYTSPTETRGTDKPTAVTMFEGEENNMFHSKVYEIDR